ncbi:ras-related protein Rab-20-like isoform X2 [Corticium candelabrum]|uniref:ras-related protein Rab-20-like isoform X2 n=1 Tax=Corticium candelabrum TaxID=121492 RepID=UPI002E267576|nr:ras-related protein Rab-20-like isoform X2 [Corticium candelabrum]
MAVSGSRQKADLKVVILGSSSVGKTSLIQRYLSGHFVENRPSTIGAAFSVKQWGNFKVAIWDTAGEERFRALSSFYSRDACAAILAYSITDKKSFEELQKHFLCLLDHARENCLLVVVGTKSDLIDEDGRQHK